MNNLVHFYWKILVSNSFYPLAILRKLLQCKNSLKLHTLIRYYFALWLKHDITWPSCYSNKSSLVSLCRTSISLIFRYLDRIKFPNAFAIPLFKKYMYTYDRYLQNRCNHTIWKIFHKDIFFNRIWDASY